MVKVVNDGELAEVADFAYEKNQKREEASMFCPKSREGIREEFGNAMEKGTLAAYWNDTGSLKGVINWYVDAEKQRTDCALLMDSHCVEYEEAAKALVEEVKRGQRPGMRYYFYFPGENERCGEFLESLKAYREENEYLLILRKDEWRSRGCMGPDRGGKNRPAGEVGVLCESRYEEYIDLHNRIFRISG